MEKRVYEKIFVRKTTVICLMISLFISGLFRTNTADVLAKAPKIKLNYAKKTLQKGKKIKLRVKKVPKSLKKRKIVWKSNKKKVASVTKKGVVKAKRKGKATIKAYIKGNKKIYGKCVITVINKKKQGKSEPSDVKGSDGTDISGTPRPTDNTTTVPKNTPGTQEPTDNATATPGTSEPSEPTKEPDIGAQVYDAILAMQSEYPEGMVWTNDNSYNWKGGIYSGGMGCAAFAFAMSDAAFGELPARVHTDYADIRVGDILRVNDNTHFVIVLEVFETEVVVAEGNYNSTIHWGRRINREELQGTGDYIMTRYPE